MFQERILSSLLMLSCACACGAVSSTPKRIAMPSSFLIIYYSVAVLLPDWVLTPHSLPPVLSDEALF